MSNQVYENKKDCCGCGACQAVCPTNAIEMIEDEYGFTYPKIDNSKCVKCGLCKKVCSFKNPKKHVEDKKNVYMAISKNDDNLKKSASGGAFIELAIQIINNNGIVYGCSMELENDKLYPKHIRVDNIEDLRRLQGSKYVQSECGNIYKFVKEDLNNDKLVLFSGTPCQIEGLKSFLQYKEYKKLILLDIICHGVPSRKMFQDYITEFEKKNDCNVLEIYFRDKKYGWGKFNKIVYEKNGQKEEIVQPCYESSFYQLFLDSSIFRENCYICPFACKERNSDLTIGDFWGVKQEYPNCEIDEKKGVSCIVINTKKGNSVVEKYGIQLEKINADFEKVARHNHQLNEPSKLKVERNTILSKYKYGGYIMVEKWYRKTRFIKNSIKKIRDLKLKR